MVELISTWRCHADLRHVGCEKCDRVMCRDAESIPRNESRCGCRVLGIDRVSMGKLT
jgi:hypothetical protein